MALKKNSPYTKFFKKRVREIIENGQRDIYRKRNLETLENCNPNLGKGTPLGFNKILSIFVILSFGIIISILILFYECIKKPRKNRHPTSAEKWEILHSIFEKLYKIDDIQDLHKINYSLNMTTKSTEQGM